MLAVVFDCLRGASAMFLFEVVDVVNGCHVCVAMVWVLDIFVLIEVQRVPDVVRDALHETVEDRPITLLGFVV